MAKLTVIDFFCGAGGFSEGFRQMGFEIVGGYDHWKPAVDTFNLNFGTNSKVKNIKDFLRIEEIEALPNTDVIIGSPPCVSFSSSNNSGKADKSLGVELTEIYLKIVAVKKHQKGSKLKAWFMENVSNSRKYLKKEYSFSDLDLTDWAETNNIPPSNIAIKLDTNSIILNSADYGSLQARKRLISGEIISQNKLIIPSQTHKSPIKKGTLPNYKTIGEMKQSFPSPFHKKEDRIIKDPQYDIELALDKVTDHFYDTGIYQVDIKFSKHWKTNHPYMGRMSFPENEKKPSRTITATRIANSRESIIYKSEVDRVGDGEFRLPTVREAAILMGFPITFQFFGSEYTKWRLVGNAVCAAVSKALATTVLQSLNLETPKNLVLQKEIPTDEVNNLNTFELKPFNNPPRKNKGAKCRWHTFKDGNMTVTLSNFRIGKDKKSQNKWFTSIQYGTGNGYPSQLINEDVYKDLEVFIEKQKNGEQFLSIMKNGFLEKIGSSQELQKLFELQTTKGTLKDPTELVEELKNIIKPLNLSKKTVKNKEIDIFEFKEDIPLKQVYALYGINKIVSIANET